VVFGVRLQQNTVRLEVWDQGPGIAEDKLQVIFEEFQRLDSHRTHAEKGLGLGLAIADGLCRVLGHPLNVRSWPGKGSVFSVTVPIAQQGRLSRPVDLVIENQPELQGAPVLCIDNESSILAGMQSLLGRWHCQVEVARNRDEVRAVLERGFIPQLVLVDYHLDAGDTGTQLMVWLRELLGADLPGVVISADGRQELISQIEIANLEYLPKPVKPAALRALISRYIALA